MSKYLHLFLTVSALAAPPADPAQADRERRVKVAIALADAKPVPAKHAKLPEPSPGPVAVAKPVLDWFGDAKACPCCHGAECKCGPGHSCGSPTCPAGCVRETAPAPRVERTAWFTADTYEAALARRSSTGRPLVILFTEPDHCAACRALEAGGLTDARVEAAMAMTVNVRVDSRTAAGAGLVSQAKVKSLPTFQVYRDGKLSGQATGAVSADELLKVLAK